MSKDGRPVGLGHQRAAEQALVVLYEVAELLVKVVLEVGDVVLAQLVRVDLLPSADLAHGVRVDSLATAGFWWIGVVFSENGFGGRLGEGEEAGEGFFITVCCCCCCPDGAGPAMAASLFT